MSDALKDFAEERNSSLQINTEKGVLDEAKLLLRTQCVLQQGEASFPTSSVSEVHTSESLNENAGVADSSEESAPAGRIVVEDSVCEEVTANFAALLNDVEFTQELAVFKIGLFNRNLRRTLLNELRMVYIGLWAYALERSFPQTASSFFQYFVDHYVQTLPEAVQKPTYDKIMDYRDMIVRSDAKDFNHISLHLLSFTKINEETLKADTLRLSLALRNHYTFIFQRLV